MRRTILLGLAFVFVCAGCVTVNIPKYIQDKSPYKKTFYAGYEETLEAAQKALKETGWQVTDTVNPIAYEQQGASEAQAKQVLIFTQARQTPAILTSRYMSLNVYVRAIDSGAEVEIRYFSVTPVLLGRAKGYKNNLVVNRVFDRMEGLLKK